MVSGAQAGAAAAAAAGGGTSSAASSTALAACTIPTASQVQSALFGSSARAEATGFGQPPCGPNPVAFRRALRAIWCNDWPREQRLALQACTTSDQVRVAAAALRRRLSSPAARRGALPTHQARACLPASTHLRVVPAWMHAAAACSGRHGPPGAGRGSGAGTLPGHRGCRRGTGPWMRASRGPGNPGGHCQCLSSQTQFAGSQSCICRQVQK